jgi:hypothetical protein
MLVIYVSFIGISTGAIVPLAYELTAEISYPGKIFILYLYNKIISIFLCYLVLEGVSTGALIFIINFSQFIFILISPFISNYYITYVVIIISILVIISISFVKESYLRP